MLAGAVLAEVGEWASGEEEVGVGDLGMDIPVHMLPLRPISNRVLTLRMDGKQRMISRSRVIKSGFANIN